VVIVYVEGVDTPIQHISLPKLLNITVYYCSDKGPLSSDGHRFWWILRGITIPLCCPAQNSRYFSTDSTCAAGITGPIPGTLTPLPNSDVAGSVFPMEKNYYSKIDTAFLTFCWPCISVYLSRYLTNLMNKICFTISFISCLYMFRAHVLIIRRS